MNKESTVIAGIFTNTEDKASVDVYYTDPMVISIKIFDEENGRFSFVAFIKALNRLRDSEELNNFKFEYLSDGALEKEVEQKLVRSILKDKKIKFDYE